LTKIITLPAVSSEFKLKDNLEEVLSVSLVPDQIQKINWDTRTNEYREYTLVSKTETRGSTFGDIDDMMEAYHEWKLIARDKSFKIFLEYEVYQHSEGVMIPSGTSKEVGVMIKITKGAL